MFDPSDKRDGLHWASTHGSYVHVNRCLQAGESPNKHNENGLTSLHLAVQCHADDVMEIIGLLLKSGADVNAKTLIEEDTALHLAVRFGNTDIVDDVIETLMATNADPQIRNKRLRRPYDYAVAKNLDQDVLDLLTNDLPPRVAAKYFRNNRGQKYGKLLIQAVIKGEMDTILTCIRKKADVNYRNENGAGAIHHTITHCPLDKGDVLDILLASGADVSLQDHEDDTALNLVIKTASLRKSSQMYNLTQTLLNRNVDTTLKDIDGKNAMMLAEERRYDDIKQLLSGQVLPIQAESDTPTNKQDQLFEAILYGTAKDVEKILLNPGINVNARTKEGLTPAHLAVMRNDKQDKENVILSLVHYEADLNAQTTKDKSTPLHLAAELNDVIAARVLTEQGVSTIIKDKAGKDAYVLAEDEKHEDVAKIIQSHRLKSKWKGAAKKSKACVIL